MKAMMSKSLGLVGEQIERGAKKIGGVLVNSKTGCRCTKRSRRNRNKQVRTALFFKKVGRKKGTN
jgi:hypothetical protein